MKYLLVMPRKISQGASTNSVIFPLGIAYVSAALKAEGFDVCTQNLDFSSESTETAIGRMITDHEIDVVCTGGLSLDYYKIKEVINVAKQVNPAVITVIGGGIVSSDPETAMIGLGADIGVIGEGERTVCELAQALDHNLPYDNIPGIVCCREKTLTYAPKRTEIKNLDSIPFPDFDGFNYSEWLRCTGGGAVLLSDRSCPFRCTFCFHPTGEKYRQRSIDSIIAEIDYQIEKFEIHSVALTSELFATKKERLMEFCERIRPYALNWSCCLRVTDVDSDILRIMKAAGCSLICYGLESGDDKVLKSMKKGISVSQIRKALDLSYEVGIATDDSNFIFGDIAETLETFNNTLALWNEYNAKTHINLSMIQTYPGTYLYDYACNRGIIRDKLKFLEAGCPLINISAMTESEYRHILSKVCELRMHPHVPAQKIELLRIDNSLNCDLAYTCRKCQHRHMIKSMFWFTSTFYCSNCGTKNEVDPFRCATIEEQSLMAEVADGPVAIWGSGGVFYKLIQKYPELKQDRFVLIDRNPAYHGLSLCEKQVYSPDVIARNEINSVIIAALSQKDKIYNELRSEFPAVRNIFVPDAKISGSEVVPYLKPH